MIDDAILVIRSAGERTLPLCRALIQEAVPAKRIVIVEERPFERALRACYEIGRDAGLPWLITVDADVLVRPDRFERYYRRVVSRGSRIGVGQPHIHDKLFVRYRRGGSKIYRGSLLGDALDFVPEEGTSLRPETFVVDKLKGEGWKECVLPVAIGLHDYGQSFRDLYRKGFLHGQKSSRLGGRAGGSWMSSLRQDSEILFVTLGYIDGMRSDDIASLDSSVYEDRAYELLARYGVVERGELTAAESEWLLETLNSMDTRFGRFFGSRGVGRVMTAIGRLVAAGGPQTRVRRVVSPEGLK